MKPITVQGLNNTPPYGIREIIGSLPDPAKGIFEILFESPKTTEELLSYPGLSYEKIQGGLNEIRERGLLIEYHETDSREVYSTNPENERLMSWRFKRKKNLKLIRELCRNSPKNMHQIIEGSRLKNKVARSCVNALVKGEGLEKYSGYSRFYYVPSEENRRLARLLCLKPKQREAYDILNKSPSGLKELSVLLKIPEVKVVYTLGRLRKHRLLYQQLGEHPKQIYFVRPEQGIEVLKDRELRAIKETGGRVAKIFELLERSSFPTSTLVSELKKVGFETSGFILSKLLKGLEERGLVRHYGSGKISKWYLPPQLEEYERARREVIDHLKKFASLEGVEKYSFSLTDLLNFTTVSDKDSVERVLSEMRDIGLTELDGDKYLFEKTSYPELLGLQEAMDIPFNFLKESVRPFKPIAFPKYASEYISDYKGQIVRVTRIPVKLEKIIDETGLEKWRLWEIVKSLLEEGTIKNMRGRGSYYFVPSGKNERLATIYTLSDSRKKVYELLKKKPLSPNKIAEELGMYERYVQGIARFLLSKGLIYRGLSKKDEKRDRSARDEYLYVKPRHKREAMIRSLGSDAFEITQIVEKEGCKTTSELAQRLNKRFKSSVLRVLGELVEYDFLKVKKSKNWNVYYTDKDDPDVVTLKSLGPKCENVHKLLKERAMRTKQVADETKRSVVDVRVFLNRLQEAGLIGENRSHKGSVWYTKDHEDEVELLLQKIKSKRKPKRKPRRKKIKVEPVIRKEKPKTSISIISRPTLKPSKIEPIEKPLSEKEKMYNDLEIFLDKTMISVGLYERGDIIERLTSFTEGKWEYTLTKPDSSTLLGKLEEDGILRKKRLMDRTYYTYRKRPLTISR